MSKFYRSLSLFFTTGLYLTASYAATNTSEPNVTALSAIIMDEDTGAILWAKDPDTPRYPASTTKIMTGMLLLENTLPTDILTAPADIDKIGESSIHLKPGEKISARDALHAIMIKSANDAAHMAAIHISGSIADFATLANQTAKRIGCTNTQFTNPHGLNDMRHTTTAKDLAIMAREAMKYPAFREAVSAKQYKLTRTNNNSPSVIHNRNKYLKMDPTADGIKTGWTIPAGYCFVGSATRDGHRIITSLLKSSKWIEDHKAMLDWTFANHEWNKIADAKKPITRAKIIGGDKNIIEVGLLNDLYLVRRKNQETPVKHTIHAKIFENIKAPIKVGTQVGIATLTDANGHEQKIPLIALEATKVAPMTTSRHMPFSYSALVALCIGGSALVVGKRKGEK